MQNELMYSFRENNVRVVMKDNEHWFAAKDVCDILGLTKVDRALSRLKEFEKDTHTMSTPGGKQKMSVINESGLYSLIFNSRKEEAEEFRYWVTSEVLPSIRKRGVYATEDVTKQVLENPQFMIELLQNLQKEREEKQNLNNKLNEQRPKVLLADSIIDSTSLISIGTLSNILNQSGINLGRNRLFEILRNNGYLIKKGDNKNNPTQYSMDLGIMEIVECPYFVKGEPKFKPSTRITGKGQLYFVNKFKKGELK